MGMNGFMRFVARVVLVSYGFQIIAPIIHATEVESRPVHPKHHQLGTSSLQHELDLIDTLSKTHQSAKMATFVAFHPKEEAQVLIPTLTFRLEQLSGGDKSTLRLSIDQTRTLTNHF